MNAREAKFFHYLVFISLLLAILAGSWAILPRLATEEKNKSVELVLDLETVRDFANKYGYDQKQFLEQMREAGLTSVAVRETTPQDLADRGIVAVYSGSELQASWGFGDLALRGERFTPTSGTTPPSATRAQLLSQIKGDRTYLVTSSRETYEWLRKSLGLRLSPDRWSVQQLGPSYLLEIYMPKKAALQFPLGFWPADLDLVKASGLALVPRPTNHLGISATEIADTFATINSLGARLVIFDGSEVPGFPNQLQALKAALEQYGLVVAMIETPVQLGHIDQKGLGEVVAGTNYRAVRLYTFYPKEMEKLSVADLIDRSVRSVRERNIRVLYLRTVDKPGFGATELASMNADYVRGLVGELGRYGLKVGSASRLEPIAFHRSLGVLLSFGILAAALWLLVELFPVKKNYLYGLWFLLILFTVALYWRVPNLARPAFALLSALVFPTLGVHYAARHWARRRGHLELATSPWPIVRVSLEGLLLASLVSFLGAFYISALLADIQYLLEIQYFRGVKLSFTLPLLLTPLIYYRWLDRKEPKPTAAAKQEAVIKEPAGYEFIWQRVKDVLGQPLLVRDVLILAAGAFVLYVYLGRSGHTAGIPVPGLEVEARSWLDVVMGVRPRTKEFLIGHPALILAPLAIRFLPRGWVFPFLAFGLVGQISLVNSFEHIRTPWLFSLWRIWNGLWLGTLLGLAGLLAGFYLLRWLEKAGVRLKREES